MRFEWDEEKRLLNLEKHGLDFRFAHLFFEAPYFESLDDREDYGEERYVVLGALVGRAVVLVYTERDGDTYRIISMRKAKDHEEKEYFRRVGGSTR